MTTPTTPQHTPTPWAHESWQDGASVSGPSGEELAIMLFRGPNGDGEQVEINGAANAALIVHRVNSHAALVEALEKAACRFLDESLRSSLAGYPKDADRLRGFADEMAAALAAAKGTK